MRFHGVTFCAKKSRGIHSADAPSKVLIAVPNFAASRPAEWMTAFGTLDQHSDPDHGRSVLTIGGSIEVLLEASISVADRAIGQLDLRDHSGEHPTFGVLDVFPFVPYGSIEDETHRAAEEVARHIEGMGVPVYRYDRADPQQRSLPQLRRFLRSESHVSHPTAGVVCLGIRDPLVAFNINFAGGIPAARDVARSVRAPTVRALGFELASRSLVQVSMNLTAPDRVGPKAAFDRVVALARDRGLELVDCEVVGLVPHPTLEHFDGLPLRRPVRSIEQVLAEKGLS